MNRLSCLLVAAAAIIPLITQGCRAPRADEPLRAYVPVGQSMEPWGPLQLSNTRLRLAALEGEMALEYAGTMPDRAGEELAGASVYRIRNADDYYEKNKEREDFCRAAPRWLAVNSTSGAPGWSGKISIAFLMLEDWSTYTPAKIGYCAGGSYVSDAG